MGTVAHVYGCVKRWWDRPGLVVEYASPSIRPIENLRYVGRVDPVIGHLFERRKLSPLVQGCSGFTITVVDE